MGFYKTTLQRLVEATSKKFTLTVKPRIFYSDFKEYHGPKTVTLNFETVEELLSEVSKKIMQGRKTISNGDYAMNLDAIGVASLLIAGESEYNSILQDFWDNFYNKDNIVQNATSDRTYRPWEITRILKDNLFGKDAVERYNKKTI